MCPMPLIQLRLQTIALGQQSGVLWREIINNLCKTFPEAVTGNAGAGKHFVFDELMQNGCHLQSVALGACCHDDLPVKNKVVRKNTKNFCRS
jgi:hypothetical protein